MRLIYKTILIICLCVVIQDVESGVQEGKNGGLNRTKTSALPVDVTLYQGYPILFDASSDSLAEFRAYVSNPLNDLVYNIGRKSDTGPGDVVEKIENPPAGIINNPALPANSEINYVITPTHQRMDVRLFGTVEPKERSGAFYVEAVQGGVTEKLTTVKTSRQATVKFLQSTLTTSIGDDISLEVNTSLPSSVLRWQHNNERISLWDGLEKVTIRDVRKADEGIYECYEDGQREEGIHGIMNLIVRKCPKQKYGLICENVCETCYNGGSCRDDTGVCVCPPGFKGTNCEESCGSNQWGATCSIECSSQEDGDCFGNLFCPPRPAQCSCIAGYSGEMCDIACTGNKFGPNCAFTCHCHECNNIKGCTGECDGGYGGDFELCQEPPVCPDGKFGKVCEFDCHCKNDVDCDRISGICLNHECAVGWGNSDCQHALPAFYHAPVPSADHVTGSISVSWDHWTQNTDYGTPPTDGFWFHYGEGALTTSKRSYQTTEILSDVHRGSEYVFAVAVVGIDNTPGALSPTASARVACIKPSQSPTITSVTMGTEAAVITWTIPNNVDDWIGCKSGVQSFTIYSDVFPAKIVNGNQRSDTISGLLPCSVYEFSITVDNADHSSYLSAPVSGNTDNEVPEKVSALTITNPTTTSLDVTWHEPSIPSPCSVSGYSVSFRLTELDQCDPTNGPIENIDTPSTVVVIDGLRSHSTYEVSVAAYSGSVYGEAVTTSAKTSESTPSAEPANIVSDNSVKNRLAFTWDPPPCGSRNGEIKQYDYVFGLDVDIGEPIRGSTGPDDRFVSFDELEHYTKYEFQVRAATSPGPGLYSDVLSVTTAESNPEGPPRNLSPEAKWMEPDQVGYSWDPPSEDLQNGRISGYSYEFNTYPESSDEEWPRTGEVSDTNIIFTDLQEDTPYQVRVRAKTSAGVGPWSGFVTATTSAHPIKQNVGLIIGAVTTVVIFMILVTPIVIMLIGYLQSPPVNGDVKSFRGFVSWCQNTVKSYAPCTSSEQDGSSTSVVFHNNNRSDNDHEDRPGSPDPQAEGTSDDDWHDKQVLEVNMQTHDTYGKSQATGTSPPSYSHAVSEKSKPPNDVHGSWLTMDIQTNDMSQATGMSPPPYSQAVDELSRKARPSNDVHGYGPMKSKLHGQRTRQTGHPSTKGKKDRPSNDSDSGDNIKMQRQGVTPTRNPFTTNQKAKPSNDVNDTNGSKSQKVSPTGHPPATRVTAKTSNDANDTNNSKRQTQRVSSGNPFAAGETAKPSNNVYYTNNSTSQGYRVSPIGNPFAASEKARALEDVHDANNGTSQHGQGQMISPTGNPHAANGTDRTSEDVHDTNNNESQLQSVSSPTGHPAVSSETATTSEDVNDAINSKSKGQGVSPTVNPFVAGETA